MLLGLDRYDTSTQRGEHSRTVSDVGADIKNQFPRLNPTPVKADPERIIGTPNHRVILRPSDSREGAVRITSDCRSNRPCDSFSHSP